MLPEQRQQAILKGWIKSVAGMKADTQLKLLEAKIEANDIDGIINSLGIKRASFEEFETAISESYYAGGIYTAAKIGKIPVPDGALVFKFDVRDPQAEKWIRDHSSNLIVEIIADQKDAVRTMLDAGLVAGNNPRTSALDLVGRINQATGKRLGGVVGLTNQQAQWVVSAREELIELNPNYLTRALRDKRFDAAFNKALESGKPLTKEQINNAIAQLENRALRYRGENIARTESLNALRAGQFQAVDQAIEIGEVDTRDAVKVWDASGDGRTRDSHAYAEGQTVPTKQPFMIGGSLMMFPGDSSLGAPASQVINCRCRSQYKIDFLGKAVRLESF